MNYIVILEGSLHLLASDISESVISYRQQQRCLRHDKIFKTHRVAASLRELNGLHIVLLLRISNHLIIWI
jgi:hypothetical protein